LILIVIACSTILLPAGSKAGPPFVTDDPEPVELHHWEVYIFGTSAKTPSGQNTEAPALEINYGAIKTLQLHLIAPYAISQAPDKIAQTGYGDTELGIKYRFVEETENRPMLGLFPHLELPTGNSNQGLGTGYLQLLAPLWLQKSWGHWTTYGGGGYDIFFNAPEKNYWLFGWELQKDLSEHLMLGGEIFTNTDFHPGKSTQVKFNLGGQVNFDDAHHLLFSAGKSISGDTDFMAYLGFQWTFGPGESKMEPEMPATKPRRF
jgi:hypothetical protein